MKKLFFILFLTIEVGNVFGQTELIQNGDFSNLTSNWTTSGNWHISSSFNCAHSGTANAYAGDANGSAVINESGDLKQTFTIPNTATLATLTFYVSKSTDEVAVSTIYDSVSVFLLDGNGNQLMRFSPTNINNLYSGKPVTLCDSYSFKSFSIPSTLFGQPLQIDFRVYSDGGPKNTMFRIDDVSLTYVPCANPVSPTGLTVTSTGCNSVDLSWNPVSGSGILYEVLKNNTSCGFVFGSSGLGPTSSTSGMVNTTPGTTYYFVVTATNSCGTSGNSNCVTTTTLVTPITPSVIPSGTITACSGTSTTLTVQSPQTGVTYNWSDGGTGITHVENINGTVYCYGTNSCGLSGNSNTVYLNLITTPIKPSLITGNTNVISGNNETYLINPITNAANYTWILPVGWSGSSTSTSITVTVGSSSGSVCVTANNSCGTSDQTCLSVSNITGIDESYVPNLFSISPNPNNGIFALQANSYQPLAISSIEIYNVLGEKVYQQQINDKRTVNSNSPNGSSLMAIDLGTQPKGIYFIRINSEKGMATKKIIIQ